MVQYSRLVHSFPDLKMMQSCMRAYVVFFIKDALSANVCHLLISRFMKRYCCLSYFSRNGFIRSMGTGNIIVEFFSVAISVRV